MEKILHNIFWTTNATDFIESILESSYKVLLRKVKIETLQQPVKLLPTVEYFDCFTFKVF